MHDVSAPTVARNTRYHEYRINQLSTRPMGPVTIDDPDSFLSFVDPATGKALIRMSPSDVQVPYKGGMASLTPTLEAMASGVELQAESDARKAAILQEAATRQAQDQAGIDYTASRVTTETDARVAAITAEAEARAAAITQEAAARVAAITAEAATRAAQDQAGLNYTSQRVSEEAAARSTGDTSTLSAANGYTSDKISAEASARSAADQAGLDYTSQKVSDEAAARSAGDSSTLDAAVGYTSQRVSAEASARVSGDASTLSAANSHATSAAAGAESRAKGYADSTSLAAEANAQNYTDQQLSSAVSNLQSKITALGIRVGDLESAAASGSTTPAPKPPADAG